MSIFANVATKFLATASFGALVASSLLLPAYADGAAYTPAPAHQTHQTAKDAVYYVDPTWKTQPVEDKVCLQVITKALNPATGEVRDFPNSCLPDGWQVAESELVSVEDFEDCVAIGGKVETSYLPASPITPGWIHSGRACSIGGGVFYEKVVTPSYDPAHLHIWRNETAASEGLNACVWIGNTLLTHQVLSLPSGMEIKMNGKSTVLTVRVVKAAPGTNCEGLGAVMDRPVTVWAGQKSEVMVNGKVVEPAPKVEYKYVFVEKTHEPIEYPSAKWGLIRTGGSDK